MLLFQLRLLSGTEAVQTGWPPLGAETPSRPGVCGSGPVPPTDLMEPGLPCCAAALAPTDLGAGSEETAGPGNSRLYSSARLPSVPPRPQSHPRACRSARSAVTLGAEGPGGHKRC